MMKKLYIFLLIIFLGIFVFINSGKTKSDTVELTFNTLQMGTFSEYINGIIANFEKENPDIKIKWIDVPYSEGEKRALAGILSDNPPDIINLNQDFAFSLAQKKALYEIPMSELEQYIEPILESVKYNDTYYAFPFYATSAITLYNKTFFGKTHVPQNYEELFALCKHFKEETNVFLTMINFNENDTLLKILNKEGINTSEDLKGEKAKKFFENLRYLYTNDYLPKESITQNHRETLEKYMSGQIAILNAGANFINLIKENAPNIFNNTEITNQLASKDNKYDYSLMNFVIPKKSKHKQEAVKFIQYVTNYENQMQLAQMTSVLPVNKYAIEDNYFKVAKSNTQEEKARILSAQQIKSAITPIQIGNNRKEFLNKTSTFIQKVLITNEHIDELISEYSEEWEKSGI